MIALFSMHPAYRITPNHGRCAPLTAYDCSKIGSVGNYTSHPIKTAGQNNHLTAFNIILVINCRFTQEAMQEAISITTEAKSRAICELGLRTPSGEIATGGSADCIAVVSGLERRYEHCCKEDTWR